MIETLYRINKRRVIDIFPCVLTAEEDAFAGVIKHIGLAGGGSDVGYEYD